MGLKTPGSPRVFAQRAEIHSGLPISPGLRAIAGPSRMGVHDRVCKAFSPVKGGA